MYPFSLTHIGSLSSFLQSKMMIYYQKILKREMEEMREKQMNSCPYCSGNGYFQLVLGGSETCPSCGGSGKKKDE
jgi:RecJ-like exonuclease